MAKRPYIARTGLPVKSAGIFIFLILTLSVVNGAGLESGFISIFCLLKDNTGDDGLLGRIIFNEGERLGLGIIFKDGLGEQLELDTILNEGLLEAIGEEFEDTGGDISINGNSI